MKQNTKFLWMYVGILFSFALILIIFAGLSRNSTTEQAQGLKADLTELSQKNTELQTQIKELDTRLNASNEEINNLKAQNEELVRKAEKRSADDKALIEALYAYNRGNHSKCAEIISTIDPQSLTETQLYLYNRISR